MHKKLQKILKLMTLLGLFLSLLIPQQVMADSAIKNVDIVQVDTTQFPDISFTINLLDSTRTPVTQLDATSLIVKENDIQVPYSFASSQRGVNVVIVLDISNTVMENSVTGKPTLDEMRTAALEFVNTVQPADAVEILGVIGNKPEVLQSFTNDSALLKKQLNAMEYRDVSLRSYGLAGVCQAITALDNAYPNPAPKLIIFMTSGIQQNLGGCLPENIQPKSRNGDIWVHTIYLGTDPAPDLQSMTESTSGKFIRYTGSSTTNALYDQINLLRQQYQLTFHSQVSSSSERTLKVSVSPESSTAPTDTQVFTVQPPPQAPAITAITVNSGSPVLRTAPAAESKTDETTPTQVPIEAKITWLDGYARKLDSAEIEVDGVPLGDMIIAKDGSLSFTWDISGYFTAGTSTARIKISARDELGMVGTAETDIPIEVSIPSAENAFCLDVQTVPAIGGFLYDMCVKYNVSVDEAANVGIGLGAVIIFIVALIIIIILLIANRKAVVKAGKKMGTQVSTVASRMTQRIGAGPKQPRAQLEVLAGDQIGKRYDLFGKTVIGRDPQKSQMTLNSPLVSREHCTFHLDMNAGKWTLEDLESANGTYLNSLLLPPHQARQLKDGDVIDLAPLPKGGIRFRFRILIQPVSTVTMKMGQQPNAPQNPDPYATQNPYATRKGITPPPAGTPTVPQQPGTPTVPQPRGIPTIPQQPGAPTVPQPGGTPTIPQQPGSPTIPQPRGIPTIPQQPAPPTAPNQPAPPTTPNPPPNPVHPQGTWTPPPDEHR